MKHFKPTHLQILVVAALLQQCGDPATKHTPVEELATFRFADPSLEAMLVASEPNINSPVAMGWAPDGALFVVEMTGYPVTPGRGAVKRLTDPDGDGYYEQMTVFDDDLDFPSSVMYFEGGVLVCDSPNIYFLKDTDRHLRWRAFGRGLYPKLRLNYHYMYAM